MSTFIYKLALAFVEYKKNSFKSNDQTGRSPSIDAADVKSDINRESTATLDSAASSNEPEASKSGEGGGEPADDVGCSDMFKRDSLGSYLKWVKLEKSSSQLGKGFASSDDLLLLRCEHWLEAADVHHRYGSNLRPYFDYWVHHENDGIEAEGRGPCACSTSQPANVLGDTREPLQEPSASAHAADNTHALLGKVCEDLAMRSALEDGKIGDLEACAAGMEADAQLAANDLGMAVSLTAGIAEGVAEPGLSTSGAAAGGRPGKAARASWSGNTTQKPAPPPPVQQTVLASKGEPAGGWQKVLEAVAATAMQRRRSSNNLHRKDIVRCSHQVPVSSAPVTPGTSWQASEGTAGCCAGGKCSRLSPNHPCSGSSPTAASEHRTAHVESEQCTPMDSRQPWLATPLSCPNLQQVDEAAMRRGQATRHLHKVRFSGLGDEQQEHTSSDSNACEDAGDAHTREGQMQQHGMGSWLRGGTPDSKHQDKHAQLLGEDAEGEEEQRQEHHRHAGSHRGVFGCSDDDDDAASYSYDSSASSPGTPPCTEEDDDDEYEYDLNDASRNNFYFWLDHGEGKALDLADQGVPRSKLESQRVRYLSPEELSHYEVIVDKATGVLRYKLSGQLLHTFPEGSGKLPDVPEEQGHDEAAMHEGFKTATDVHDLRGEQGEQPCRQHNLPEAGQQQQQEGGKQPGFSEGAGAAGQQEAAAATGVEEPANSDAKKWIWVVAPCGKLYVHAKVRGQFHHSSFLRGAAVLAAGNLLADRGQLVKLTADSGHYWPQPDHFRWFYDHLASQGADLKALEGIEFRTKH